MPAGTDVRVGLLTEMAIRLTVGLGTIARSSITPGSDLGPSVGGHWSSDANVVTVESSGPGLGTQAPWPMREGRSVVE